MKSIPYPLITLIFFMVGCGSSQESPEGYIPDYEGEWTTPPVNTPTNMVPDGAICGNGDIGMVLGGTPEDQTLYFSKNDFWKAKNGYPDGGVCYIGQLHILSSGMKGAKYHVVQKISDATLHGDFTKDNGDSYQMDAWCSATKNVAVIGLQAGSSPVEFTLNFIMEETMGAKVEKGVEDGMEWYVRKFDDPSLEWPTAVSACIKAIGRKSPSKISLAAGEKSIIIVSFCTNHDQDEYVKGSKDLLGTVTSESLDSLYESHKEWWASFWDESRVDLDDKELEKYYYGSQYLLACCSRNTAFPPGLWGTSLTMDATAGGWAGDYHTNYNFMAPWWGAYSSNHIGLSEPYDTPILEYMDNGFRHAKELLNKKGVYYPVGIGPKGFCSSMFPLTREGMLRNYGTPETGIEGGYMFLGQKSDAVFCTANMFMRFYSTYDREYAEKVYPFIKAVADFWEDYLVYEDGRYVSYNDSFWEVGPWEGRDWKKNYGDINPTVSLGLCRMLFKGIIDMSGYLQRDQDKVEKWNHILEHLSPIPTVEVNGVTRIKACEGGNGSGSRTAPGFGRVMMHGLVFPSGVCGPVTDSAFARILLDEVYRWGTDTTKAEWKDADWTNLSNGFETYFTSAARLGYDGERLLAELKNRIQKTAEPNLWITQGGGGTETLSAVPSCINEMLLQSYEGVVRLFPVWPKDREASFQNLRAYGAFLISSACSDGNVEYVTIKSEKGRNCKIENPWPKESCLVTRGDGSKEKYDSRIFEIKTNAGETIKLEGI